MPRFTAPVVSSADILPGAVTTAALADGAVTTIKIANLAVTNAKIDNLAVDTAKIANLAVTDAKIANLAVTNAKIANATISSAKIVDLTALKFRTATSGERLEIDGNTGESFLRLYNTGGTEVGRMGYDPSGFGTNVLGIKNTSGLGSILLSAAGIIELFAGGSGGFGVMITNVNVAGGSPGRPFRVGAPSGNTGHGFQVWDSTAVATPTWAFAFDDDTGIRRAANNVLGVVTGATQVATFSNGVIAFPGAGTTTNSGLAAWRNNGFPGTVLLALSSSRKLKTAIRDADPAPILAEIDAYRPRRYRSRAGGDDGRRVFLGIVAEEAPAGFTYESLIMPLLVAAQDARRRLAAAGL